MELCFGTEYGSIHCQTIHESATVPRARLPLGQEMRDTIKNKEARGYSSYQAYYNACLDVPRAEPLIIGLPSTYVERRARQ